VTGRSRILVISSFLPSRESGGRVRLRALMRRLAESHSLSLLSYVPPTVASEVVDEVRAQYDDVVTVPHDRLARGSKRALQLRSLLSTRSFERLAYEGRSFQAALDRILERSRFDVVHVEGCAMANFTFPADVPIVLDEQNIEYDVLRRVASVTRALPRRIYNYLDYLKLRSEEERAWRAVDACAVTSSRDESFIKRVLPGAHTAVVPNGVDCEFFTPTSRPIERGTLLFFGEMGYYPNTDAMLFFIREVLPLLRRARRAVKLVVVGPSAPHAIRQLASWDVVVTGPVDDLRPYLQAAQVVVVPLRLGGGTRLKILEAMAMGKPVVSTRLGAEGLDVTHEGDILLADGADAFATEVQRVLDDDDLAQSLGRAGRMMVESRYDWKASVRRLEALYETAMLAHGVARAA
jgi:glycosyltransferase involved in cell wall biosynthesis